MVNTFYGLMEYVIITIIAVVDWIFDRVIGIFSPILPNSVTNFILWIYDGLTSPPLINFYTITLGIILILVVTIVNAIMLIWVERKFIARLMDRRGPTEVGYAGLLQNIADGIKLFTKEVITPKKADKSGYLIAPIVYIGTSCLLLVAIPWYDGFTVGIFDISAGVLLIFAIFSLAPFMIFIAGWASNNKFTLIGGMRSAAQMISYEIPLMLSLVSVIILAGSFSLTNIVHAQSSMWFAVLQPIGFIVFLTAIIAEVERIPFDIPEAEAELVEGWFTEYGSMRFALIMFTEYIRGYAGAAIAVSLFLGGWSGPFLPGIVWFFIKVYLVFMLFVWVRASLPRVRIDQLLNVSWKRLLPLSLIAIITSVVMLELKLLGWSIAIISLVSLAIFGIVILGLFLSSKTWGRETQDLRRMES